MSLKSFFTIFVCITAFYGEIGYVQSYASTQGKISVKLEVSVSKEISFKTVAIVDGEEPKRPLSLYIVLPDKKFSSFASSDDILVFEKQVTYGKILNVLIPSGSKFPFRIQSKLEPENTPRDRLVYLDARKEGLLTRTNLEINELLSFKLHRTPGDQILTGQVVFANVDDLVLEISELIIVFPDHAEMVSPPEFRPRMVGWEFFNPAKNTWKIPAKVFEDGRYRVIVYSFKPNGKKAYVFLYILVAIVAFFVNVVINRFFDPSPWWRFIIYGCVFLFLLIVCLYFYLAEYRFFLENWKDFTLVIIADIFMLILCIKNLISIFRK